MKNKPVGTIEWIESNPRCKTCAELRAKGIFPLPDLPKPDTRFRCVLVPVHKKEEKEN